MTLDWITFTLHFKSMEKAVTAIWERKRGKLLYVVGSSLQKIMYDGNSKLVS